MNMSIRIVHATRWFPQARSFSSASQLCHSPFRVAIAGAGIGGLALCNVLAREATSKNYAVDVTLFERRSKNHDQGTGFDIGSKEQEILKRAGIFHRYWEISRESSNVMKFYILGHKEPSFVMSQLKTLERFFPPTPETNREKLQQAFIEELPEHNSNINFGAKVHEIKPVGDNKTEIFDESGESLGVFDLVVDASGTESKFRKLRVDQDAEDIVDKEYTGITMVHGVVPDPDLTCDEELVKMLGQGTVTTFGPRARMFTLQRYGASLDDHRTSLFYSVYRESPTSLMEDLGISQGSDMGPRSTYFSSNHDPDKLQALKRWMHEDMGDKWGPKFHHTVDQVNQVWLRPLMQHTPTPAFLENDTLPLICIGDALHTVPPYTGAGGNLALVDAGKVADCILSHVSSGESNIIPSLRAVEKDLMKDVKDVLASGEHTKKFLSAFKDIEDLSSVSLKELVKNPFVYSGMRLFQMLYNLEVKLGIRAKGT
eukprot:m.339877 g.339877  ORF g.339877 m.339877 type:complete len:485 (-) comp19021_c0_seq1:50-1504(-)